MFVVFYVVFLVHSSFFIFSCFSHVNWFSDGTIRKNDVGFYRLSIVTLRAAVSNYSAEIYHRMSPTLKSTKVGHFWPNLRRKGLTDVSQIWTLSWGLSYAKQIASIPSAVWAQCTNMTDRPQNGDIDTNRRNRVHLKRYIIQQKKRYRSFHNEISYYTRTVVKSTLCLSCFMLYF